MCKITFACLLRKKRNHLLKQCGFRVKIAEKGGRMKYKPTIFPITMAVAKMGSPGWTFLTGLAEVALNVKLAQEGVPLTYSCGKPGCNGSFNLVPKINRPLVCPECGSEIDWTGIATKKVKRCPTCHRLGNDFDKYCKFHAPAVPLQEVEEPI